MLPDYHMHTIFSDGKGIHKDYLDRAKEAGLAQIGFSEHICFKDVRWSVHADVLDHWIETMQKLRAESAFPVLFGVEMDYLENREEEIAAFLQRYDFDYVLGSVHFIDDWNFDVNQLDKFEEYDTLELYEKYFTLVRKAAESGLFDIMSHADLIKKFNYRPRQDVSEIFRQTARAFKTAGVAYEINTSGLNKKCAEFYPSLPFVEACCQAGVPVTLGSDAHRPEEVGQYFAEAVTLLKDVGYTELATFAARQRKMISLADLQP